MEFYCSATGLQSKPCLIHIVEEYYMYMMFNIWDGPGIKQALICLPLLCILLSLPNVVYTEAVAYSTVDSLLKQTYVAYLMICVHNGAFVYFQVDQVHSGDK